MPSYLLVQHGYGLHGLDRVREFDDSVPPGLSLLVPVEFRGYNSTGQSEHLAKLLLVHAVRKLEEK